MVSTLDRRSIPLDADRAWWLAAAATVAGFVALALAQFGSSVAHGLHFTVYMLATGQWNVDHAFNYIAGSLPIWLIYQGVVRQVLWTFLVYIQWWSWEGVAMAYSFMLSTGVGGVILGILSGAVLG